MTRTTKPSLSQPAERRILTVEPLRRPHIDPVQSDCPLLTRRPDHLADRARLPLRAALRSRHTVAVQPVGDRRQRHAGLAFAENPAPRRLCELDRPTERTPCARFAANASRVRLLSPSPSNVAIAASIVRTNLPIAVVVSSVSPFPMSSTTSAHPCALARRARSSTSRVLRPSRSSFGATRQTLRRLRCCAWRCGVRDGRSSSCRWRRPARSERPPIRGDQPRVRWRRAAPRGRLRCRPAEGAMVRWAVRDAPRPAARFVRPGGRSSARRERR